MLRLFFILLFMAVSGVRAEPVPPEANGGPNEVPTTQEPAIGWSLQNLDPEQRQRMLRFSTFVNGGIPQDYLNVENTVGYTIHAIAEGGAEFQREVQHDRPIPSPP